MPAAIAINYIDNDLTESRMAKAPKLENDSPGFIGTVHFVCLSICLCVPMVQSLVHFTPFFTPIKPGIESVLNVKPFCKFHSFCFLKYIEVMNFLQELT